MQHIVDHSLQGMNDHLLCALCLLITTSGESSLPSPTIRYMYSSLCAVYRVEAEVMKHVLVLFCGIVHLPDMMYIHVVD